LILYMIWGCFHTFVFNIFLCGKAQIEACCLET
jgi:hypothetical protein